MNFFAFSSLLTAFIPLILIVIILSFGKSRIHRIWALCTLSISIWGIGTYLVATAKSPQAALFAWRIAFSGALYISVFFYHTVCIFGNLSRKKTLFLVYSQAIFFHLLSISTEKVFTGWHLVFGSLYYNTATVAYYLTASGWLITVLLGHYELFEIYKKVSGFKRIQTLYLLFGFFCGFVGGFLCLAPAVGINLYPSTSSSGALYAIIATYAILRYRLLDVKVAITRTGIFIFVYTLVLGLPFILATWFRVWLIEIFGTRWWVAPLSLMATLATIGPFIYIYLQRKAENNLLKEQHRYQQTLKQASVGMTRIRDLNKLLNLIAHIVTKTVRISYAAIYLYDEQKEEFLLHVSRDKGRIPIAKMAADNPLISWLMINRDPLIYEEIKRKMEDTGDETLKHLEENMRLLTASVIIPSFLEDKFMGFFVLGDKISGQIYTPEDLNVFQVLASQAALAIENAEFYNEAQEMQEQISQAEKMATIGTMADGLSHQINNRFYALSLIAGDTIDTIKLTDTSKCTPEVKQMIEEISHALGRIQSNVVQGGEVVKGLLKYSRKGDEAFEPLELNTIIDNTLEMVQFKVKLSEVDIIRNFGPETPKINGNMVQLEEAFFNFIDNGYDAIVERRNTLKEEGYRGRITVSAKPKEGMLEVVIEDNGMGVKDDDMKKIFTPFFTTKTSSRKGTGLGLYVIKRIITDTHKGKISFESSYKIGTRFILELPLAK